MRVTMSMTTNKMLLQINRNAVRVDKLYSQMTSGKKIQFPSDDPIIASRALKFRTNISETEQYQRNAQQGMSWMEITESAYTNIIKGLKRIRELSIQGSTDSLEASDRAKVITEIQSLYEQLCSEMNIDYAGRYVFSGYRTDEPPTFTESNKASFDIQQMLSVDDIEKTICYWKQDIGQPPERYENVARLKLPYTEVTNLTQLTMYDKNGVVTGVRNIVTKPREDTAYTSTDNCYTVNSATANPNGDIYYIPETGELILPDSVVADLSKDALGGIELNYTKTKFAIGELNPKVYFNCTQTVDKNGKDVSPRIATDADVWHYATAADVANGLLDADTGLPADSTTVPPSRVLNGALDSAGNALVLTSVGTATVSNQIYRVTINDVITPTPPALPYTIPIFNPTTAKSTQEFQFEFGASTLITVNNQSRNTLLASMVGDLRSLINDLGAVKLSSTDEIKAWLKGQGFSDALIDGSDGSVGLAAQQTSDEAAFYRGFEHDRFNNMIGMMDAHLAKVSTEHTLLGSRMNRMEMIEERLENDVVSYTKLMSDNENVDYVEAAMRFNEAQSVYQAALMTGARVAQLSLADYIR